MTKKLKRGRPKIKNRRTAHYFMVDPIKLMRAVKKAGSKPKLNEKLETMLYDYAE